jgi:hypothetical protein
MDRNRHKYRWTNRYRCETDKQMERKIKDMHGQMEKQMQIKILDMYKQIQIIIVDMILQMDK